MAAPLYHELKLLWRNSKMWLCQGARRRFTLCSAQQQKKKSSKGKNKVDVDDKLNELFSTSQQTLRLQRSSRGKKVENSELSSETNDVQFIKSRCMKAPTFKQILHERYSEAKRSVIVRTQNPESTIQSLLLFGRIKHAHFTTQDKCYILAEYASEDSVSELRSSASFFNEHNQFPMRSRLFYDTSNSLRKRNSRIPELHESNWHYKSSNIYPAMDTIEQELEELYTCRSLDDNTLRSRFFVCLQLEELVQSFLPESHIIPYGSCMNGFGWWNSDLDMMLCFNNELYSSEKMLTSKQHGKVSNFKILTETFSNSRQLAQHTLTMVASLLRLTPRVQNIVRILNARVPIIRFKHEAVHLHCDISIQAMDSIKMTELLYLYSVCDPRVQPLMAAIKQWAISHNLTSSGEQQKPTTIGLLTMLIFFLQTRSPPIVPTLRKLQFLANTTEMFYIEEVLYGLPSNPSSIPKSQNTETTENLLHGFFTFYSDFDFINKAISIIEGDTYAKPSDSSPVHIENPLCIGLNICRNISSAQLKLLTNAMKEAAQKLEATAGDLGNSRSNLTSLPKDNSKKSRLSFLFSSTQSVDQPVMVEISDLFTDNNSISAHDNDPEKFATENNSIQIQ